MNQLIVNYQTSFTEVLSAFFIFNSVILSIIGGYSVVTSMMFEKSVKHGVAFIFMSFLMATGSMLLENNIIFPLQENLTVVEVNTAEKTNVVKDIAVKEKTVFDKEQVLKIYDYSDFFVSCFYLLCSIALFFLIGFLFLYCKDYYYYFISVKRADYLISRTNSIVDITNNITEIDNLINKNNFKVDSNSMFKNKIISSNKKLKNKRVDLESILNKYETDLNLIDKAF